MSTSSVFKPQRGFSLIELMVAIAIGLLLTVAILIMQLKLTGQNTVVGDVRVRDAETRAAVSMVSNDLASAGFLTSGSAEYPCYAVLAYNKTYPTASKVQAFYSAWGMSGGAGVQLPFVIAPGITLSYPPAGSANRSDVLLVTATDTGSGLSPSNTPTFETSADATAYTPLTTGVLPLVAAYGNDGSFNDVHVNDIALVAPAILLPNPAQPAAGSNQINLNNRRLCFRFPIGGFNAGTRTITAGVGGTQMPTDYFVTFAAQVAATGTSDTLTDGSLRNSARIIDIVQAGAATPGLNNRWVYAYFVDNVAVGANTVPTLVRAKIDLTTDTEVAGSRVQIASGVVSFQVMFGVDPTWSGAVTGYQTGAQLIANQQAGYVRRVKLAIVTRTLFDDPQAPAVSKVSIGDPDFADYIPTSAEQKRHFNVVTAEVAVRN